MCFVVVDGGMGGVIVRDESVPDFGVACRTVNRRLLKLREGKLEK